MIEGCPSLTAYRVALRRAAHQVLDRPRVFDDPLAVAIAGVTDGEALFLNDPREQTGFAKAMRAFMAVRSRLAEDALAVAVSSGVAQYVVLGAGLDTFAYRSPYGDSLTVFEVDHPATQAWKRAQLRESHLDEPPWVRFVAVDFESQSGFEALASSGLNPSRPVWFTWLGVSMYLTNATVSASLRAMGQYPSGSGVVFDYAVDPSMLGPITRRVVEDVARRVEQAGEPWRSSFTPAEVHAYLSDAGFTAVHDRSGDDVNAECFADRTDGLRVGSAARIVTARV